MTAAGALALGVIGWATGKTVIVLPGDRGPGLAWAVAPPGALIAATGLLAFGLGCLGFWWWQDRARWPTRLGVVGLALVAAGQLLAWLA